MATYGETRGFLKQLFPDISIELLDGWIQARYTEILDRLPWKRAEAETVIQAPDSYQTGTVSVTRGSRSVTGSGTTFTSDMDGLVLRVSDDDQYYQFAYTSPTSGTLDRPYEGPDKAGASYRIDQAVFLLPEDCRIPRAVRPLFGGRPVEVITPGELNRRDPMRQQYGTPTAVAFTWDTPDDPPQMQMELHPIPDSPNAVGATMSWALDYIYEPATPTATATSLLPWIRPAALRTGVQADAWAHKENLAQAQYYEQRFEQLVLQIMQRNALERGPTVIRLAQHLTRHSITPRYRRSVPAGDVNATAGDWPE